MRTISEKTSKALARGAYGTAYRSLIADGFNQPTDFINPRSDSSTLKPEEYENLKAAIIAGFTADVRELLTKPVKSLTDEQKPDRRYWAQQISALIATYRLELKQN